MIFVLYSSAVRETEHKWEFKLTKNESLNSQKTSCISPSQVSYEMSILRIWEKSDSIIMALYCIYIPCYNHNEIGNIPDSKVHGANMGPTWILSVPGGPHVGPMNLAIRDELLCTVWGLVMKCYMLYVLHHIIVTIPTMHNTVRWYQTNGGQSFNLPNNWFLV